MVRWCGRCSVLVARQKAMVLSLAMVIDGLHVRPGEIATCYRSEVVWCKVSFNGTRWLAGHLPLRTVQFVARSQVQVQDLVNVRHELVLADVNTIRQFFMH